MGWASAGHLARHCVAGRLALHSGGAATGIGAAIARRFGQEGTCVAVADINESEGVRSAAAIDGLFVRCDTGQNLAVDGGWTIGHAPLRWPEL
jgi:NAD(P)-dependent dehydrogenase (short-subunit alcohol dehydrogenase family)